MEITRRNYIAIFDDGTVIAGQIRHSDDLRAELEAAKHKITIDRHAVHFGTIVVWAAAVRLGQTHLDYRTFEQAIDELKINREVVEVDPTRPAITAGPLSSSPTTSQPSPGMSGPTPTSTTV